MTESAIAILVVLGGIAAVLLMRPSYKKPRVHMIDAIDLMRVEDIRRTRPTGRWSRARLGVIAIVTTVVASLVWGLLSR